MITKYKTIISAHNSQRRRTHRFVPYHHHLKQMLITFCRICVMLSIFLLVFACNNEKIQNNSEEITKISDTIIRKEAAQVIQKVFKAKKIDYDTLQWKEILFEEDSIFVDMKYAGVDNFVEEQMYECSRCLLRPEVAEALLKAQKDIARKGYKLKVLDCYRPRPVQQRLWDKVPNASYVTPPKKGSMHNRGTAVDLTIVNEKNEELDMGTAFDFFGRKAHHDFYDLPENVLENRQLLKRTMKKAGFLPIRTEWWHYYFAKGAPKSHDLSDYEWSCEHSKDGI